VGPTTMNNVNVHNARDAQIRPRNVALVLQFSTHPQQKHSSPCTALALLKLVHFTFGSLSPLAAIYVSHKLYIQEGNV